MKIIRGEDADLHRVGNGDGKMVETMEDCELQILWNRLRVKAIPVVRFRMGHINEDREPRLLW